MHPPNQQSDSVSARSQKALPENVIGEQMREIIIEATASSIDIKPLTLYSITSQRGIFVLLQCISLSSCCELV